MHAIVGMAVALYVMIGCLGCLAYALRRRSPWESRPRSWPRLAVLIAAHNEEAVVGRCVASVVADAASYPGEVRCYVVADACTDRTADVSRRVGAEVIELPDGGRGKQVAVARALQFVAQREDWDGLVLLDADNQVLPGTLRALGDALARGAAAAQGYLVTANPRGSWVSSSYAVAYWWTQAVVQAGREGLGLSAMLGGTGCAIARRTLEAVPWEPNSVSDDLEYTVRLVLAGRRVTYVPAARVTDEKPEQLATSIRQRTRWIRGHCQVYARYGLALLRRALRGDLRAADLLLYGLQPYAAGFGLLAQLVLILRGGLVDYLAAAGAAILMVAPAVPLRYWDTLWTLPLYSWTALPALVWGVATWRRRTWSRTPHTGSLRGLAMVR